MKSMHRPLVTPRAWRLAAALVCIHFLAWAWVSWRGVQYDGGENLLWWLVAFLVFPASAVLAVVFSFIRGQLGWRKQFGE